MVDCKTNAQCIERYPSAPICHKSSGKCVPFPSSVTPSNFFDKNDACKRSYGVKYVYVEKSGSCMLQRCNPLNDKCPKPSWCVQGDNFYRKVANRVRIRIES